MFFECTLHESWSELCISRWLKRFGNKQKCMESVLQWYSYDQNNLDMLCLDWVCLLLNQLRYKNKKTGSPHKFYRMKSVYLLETEACSIAAHDLSSPWQYPSEEKRAGVTGWPEVLSAETRPSSGDMANGRTDRVSGGAMRHRVSSVLQGQSNPQPCAPESDEKLCGTSMALSNFKYC